MENSRYLRNDRRQFLRIVYRPSESPILKIGKKEYELSDLNENGLGIMAADEITFDETIIGLIIFKDGETIGIKGKPIWKKDNKLGIEFFNPLPAEIIIREHKLRSEKLKSK